MHSYLSQYMPNQQQAAANIAQAQTAANAQPGQQVAPQDPNAMQQP